MSRDGMNLGGGDGIEGGGLGVRELRGGRGSGVLV